MNFLRLLLKWFLRLLYRVEVAGLEHYPRQAERLLVVANHTSFLDGALLALFIPHRLAFAIHPKYANAWWMRPVRSVVDLIPMEPSNPLAVKGLIHEVKGGLHAAIFPEGRITVTGGLMKIYDGPALVADKADAMILPVRIEGPQYTPFSRLGGRYRLRWFPKVRLTVRPPARIELPPTLRGRERRHRAGLQLQDLLVRMMFETSAYRHTVFRALLDARTVHGGGHLVMEDVQRQPLNYRKVVLKTLVLGRLLSRLTREGERVGVLLPSANAAAVTFFALNAFGRVPAMLNFTVGAAGMRSACATALVENVITSRRFVEQAGLQEAVAGLGLQVKVHFLEDVAAGARVSDKLWGLLVTPFARPWQAWTGRDRGAEDPAVVLFTSGSEGAPKGVVLSHANLLANRAQIAAKVDFLPQDVILNALPLFHSFGLTAGTLLPVTSGMKVFFYPSPLHYRIVPEVAYEVGATILFGTNTFLAGYGKHAHPYDFYRMRYVFAGAEKLADSTRLVWQEKFGVRVFEGYGTTETAPVVSVNTPMEYKPGSVGRLLPGMACRLEPVPGVEEGGRLWVSGPNIMSGYLLAKDPGVLVPPPDGWYDTGDIVSLDQRGFITIRGRAKRFAKIGGEMVSLAAAEELASRLWPEAAHAVVTRPDERKGEQLVLVTTQKNADRSALSGFARAQGAGELGVPRRVLWVKHLPVLGTGKIDYRAVEALAAAD